MRNDARVLASPAAMAPGLRSLYRLAWKEWTVRSSGSDTGLCEVCGAQFPAERLLQDHRRGAHGNRCPICDSEFTTEAMLADHERTHENPTAPQREERLADAARAQAE